jgi:hypothetical protein
MQKSAESRFLRENVHCVHKFQPAFILGCRFKHHLREKKLVGTRAHFPRVFTKTRWKVWNLRFHKKLQKSVPLSADFYINLRWRRGFYHFSENAEKLHACASCDLNLSKTFKTCPSIKPSFFRTSFFILISSFCPSLSFSRPLPRAETYKHLGFFSRLLLVLL